VYTETILASDLIAPAHVQVKDFDLDGDKDLLVAVLGLLYPPTIRSVPLFSWKMTETSSSLHT
jgi:hypothetical protein